MHIHPLGDRAFTIEVDGGIDAETLERIRTIALQLRQAAIDGVTDIVPAYASVAVHYEPAVADAVVMREVLLAALRAPVRSATSEMPRVVEIPVAYGGAEGPDLAEVAAGCGLSAEEVVAIHSRATYTVHMIGFVPGFPYLGGLDPRLATPRRASPRTLVPAGSVGIGGAQTGVYPVASPGGWHLIGRTSATLFDPARNPPALLRLGDHVRFVPSEGW